MATSHEDCISIARAELTLARRMILNEIAAYPAPISGCDAQFNHLLAERARVADALAALDARPFIATPRQLAPTAQVESR